MKTTVALLIAALTATSPAATAQSKGGKLQTRYVFVRIVDQRGGPVNGLTAGDFNITEAGVARTVTHAGPAEDPMRIALFLDPSDAAAPALNHLRTATTAFSRRAAAGRRSAAGDDRPPRRGCGCSPPPIARS